MQREEFLQLFEKHLSGTITPDEEIRLSAWFDKQQSDGLAQWDEKELGNKKELGDQIYSNIQRKTQKSTNNLYNPWLKVAATIIIMSAISVLCYKINLFNTRKTKDVAYTDITAGYGQVLKIKLADGSAVWLNAGSHLRYPKIFNGKTRELYLEGEAFFEVKHKKQQPFIVHSGELNTQVLGTTFNIKAYKSNKMPQVTVATGKVAVYTKQVKAIFLTPHQTAVFNKRSHKLNIEYSTADDITSWKHGKLIYRNEQFSQAMEDIANKYGVKITADPKIQSCRIYGTFNHDNVETLLKMISYSVNGKVIKRGAEFYITGLECK